MPEIIESDIIRTKMLEIQDSKGITKIAAGMDANDWPQIVIQGEDAVPRMRLCLWAGHPTRPQELIPEVALYDERGIPRISLTLLPDGDPVIAVIAGDRSSSVQMEIGGDYRPHITLSQDNVAMAIDIPTLEKIATLLKGQQSDQG